jgi:hypothetical protein
MAFKQDATQVTFPGIRCIIKGDVRVGLKPGRREVLQKGSAVMDMKILYCPRLKMKRKKCDVYGSSWTIIDKKQR